MGFSKSIPGNDRSTVLIPNWKERLYEIVRW
jgi:hypothetical protein